MRSCRAAFGINEDRFIAELQDALLVEFEVERFDWLDRYGCLDERSHVFALANNHAICDYPFTAGPHLEYSPIRGILLNPTVDLKHRLVPFGTSKGRRLVEDCLIDGVADGVRRNDDRLWHLHP